MTEPNKAPPQPKKTPVVATRGKAIVIGVTDLRELYKTPSSALPPEEVTVRLHDGKTKTTLTKHTWRLPKGGPEPRLWARFEEEVVPGIEYTATAFRRVGSEVVATALPKAVTLPKNAAQAEKDLELHHIPILHLVQARFEGDHGMITREPDKVTYERTGKYPTIISDVQWGDGNGVPVKPEYLATLARHNPAGKSSTKWDVASYDHGATVALWLKLQASVPDKRPHRLELLRVHGGDKALTFETQVSETLIDGGFIELELLAQAPLPDKVGVVGAQLVLTASGDDHPLRIERASHRVEVFVLLGKPYGKVEMHEKQGSGEMFPESGPTQKVTPLRLRRAVEGATGATGHEQAVRMLFAFLRREGIRYFPYYRFPTIEEQGQDDYKNTTGFKQTLSLHDFLWLAMAVPKICHCLDLAAGFRLLACILGVEGQMTARQCFPWPPWDAQGNRRDLDKDGEPWQGSLSKYTMPFGRKLVFIDSWGTINVFEGVLRYVPPGSQRAMLLPIGEADIFEAYGPNVKPGPMDDRNASLFFQASEDDKWKGRFQLAVKLPGKNTGYLKPPFEFMTHKDQYRFRFQYHPDTFEAGDDEEP